jgi:hypothetical protein
MGGAIQTLSERSMRGQILGSSGAGREVRLHAPHVKEQRRRRHPRAGRAVALELFRPVVALVGCRRRPVSAGKASQIVGGHGAIVPMIRPLIPQMPRQAPGEEHVGQPALARSTVNGQDRSERVFNPVK